jgi:antirestriction protein
MLRQAMSLCNQLSRLKKVSEAVGLEEVHEFFRCLQDHGSEPTVYSALDALLCLMRTVEETLRHPITTQQWLKDDWLESKGLLQAINRLFREVHACSMTKAGDVGVGQ